MKSTLERLIPVLYEAVTHVTGIKKTLSLVIQYTKKEFPGYITLVIFPLMKILKQSPEKMGNQIGKYVKKHSQIIQSFRYLNGFLNFECTDSYYNELLKELSSSNFLTTTSSDKKTLMIEYSSPNTNKPLHLGHIRNMVLGHSISELLKSVGKKVIKIQILNDRGIHICKSMLACNKFSGGETPENSGLKGDHLVGKYYVCFEKAYRKEVNDLCAQGFDEKKAKKEAPIMQEVHQLLRLWESGDEKILALWKKMNNWVYQGFKKTYRQLDINFDYTQYESNTYLLGKRVIEEGIKKKVFFYKEDGSVWVDLTKEGLDEKLLLRANGTAVYLTQDLGTTIERFEKYPIDSLIYLVGEEQKSHFRVLFLILKKLGYVWADKLFHLSYGMVELPEGKMKSREGIVVDADDLLEQMNQVAKKITKELGKVHDYSSTDLKTLSLGALKYHLLKVDPKKRILFNPETSVDFKGNTGTYIQYTYSRIRSLERKAMAIASKNIHPYSPSEEEKYLLKILEQYPSLVKSSAANFSPAILANYIYELAKSFNDFYQNVSVKIIQDKNLDQAIFRLKLSILCGEVLKLGLKLLGINMPERM
ncbi:MAG: arginine--tRNA ligase [Candidatus Walczuchella monophlebidarum]